MSSFKLIIDNDDDADGKMVAVCSCIQLTSATIFSHECEKALLPLDSSFTRRQKKAKNKSRERTIKQE